MKILKRTQFGDPILRQKSKNVSLAYIKTATFKNLVRDMFWTMHKVGGIGLAAPQIGKSLNLAIIQIGPSPSRPNLKKGEALVLINPKIIRYSKNKKLGWEGCLSFTEARGKVPRAQEIVARFYDEKGKSITKKVSGLLAAVFQHEVDHLNGITYMDRMPNMKTLMTFTEFKKRVLKKHK